MKIIIEIQHAFIPPPFSSRWLSRGAMGEVRSGQVCRVLKELTLGQNTMLANFAKPLRLRSRGSGRGCEMISLASTSAANMR